MSPSCHVLFDYVSRVCGNEPELKASIDTIRKNARMCGNNFNSFCEKMIFVFYSLMHKNSPVAVIDIDNDTGKINKLRSVENSDLLPIGVAQSNPSKQANALKEWYESRSIPSFRDDLSVGLKNIGIDESTELIPMAYGVSVVDRYWLKRVGSELTWESVSLSNNAPSSDVGLALWNERSGVSDFFSPDSTTDGFLKKRWELDDKQYFLIKEGTGLYQQEPFSEKVVSDLLKELNVPHVDYDIIWRNNIPYSKCKNFVPDNMEFIPAWYITHVSKQPNNKSAVQHFADCCNKLNIPFPSEHMNQMYAIDYVVNNVDRHLGNFGFLRDADTLEIVGPVPIFDNGNSLFYDKENIPSSLSAPQKPFGSSRHDQIDLITDYSWLNFSYLSRLRDIIWDNGLSYVEHGLMTEDRLSAIADATDARAKHLERKAVGLKRNLQSKQKSVSPMARIDKQKTDKEI